MSWSPNVADLPVTGEKPISSQKWKNVVYDIYNKLNIIRLLNTGVVAPVDAETGMPWVDTSNGITLKLYNALDLQWHALAFYSDLLASNVVVTPSGNLSASDVQAAVIELQADIDTRLLSAEVVTEATANKVLRLNADSKLPASITGDADTVDGKHASDLVLVAEKDQPGGYAGLDANGALNSKIRSTYISDFNTATIGGLYYVAAETLNGPPISGGYALTALVIDRIGYSGVTQIAFRVPDEVYIRFSANSSNTEWTDWKRLDETTWGSISGTLANQTDLQTALDGKQSVSEKDQPGGYAGLDANGALTSKIRSTYISDFNEATIGGLYRVNAATLNKPPVDWPVTALVIDCLGSSDLTQIVFCRASIGKNIYMRFSNNASNTEWTNWIRADQAADWGNISGTLADQTDLQAALDGKVDTSPAMTGSATLNGTTNNTVQLTGIVTTLGLEVGDVIRIQYSGYDKLHTVESITDDNSIIVNYEHAGNRGNGSLRLADETTTVTITRIAKWYNAPVGLGQAWQAVTGSRVAGTTYTNTTGRPIQIFITFDPMGNTPHFLIDGVNILPNNDVAYYHVACIVPVGSTYRMNTSGTGVQMKWMELR